MLIIRVIIGVEVFNTKCFQNKKSEKLSVKKISVKHQNNYVVHTTVCNIFLTLGMY